MGAPTFQIGKKYKRKDVYATLGLPEETKGGNWDTGYNKYLGHWFLFCNIESPGRTGHDYNNHFIGDELVWFGKTGSKLAHPSIQSMIYPEGKIYIFYRDDDRQPFIFAGTGKARSWEESSPVKIIWEFQDDTVQRAELLPEELTGKDKFREGAAKQVTVNIYERDPNARRKCIEHYGTQCCICNTDFETLYGEIGAGFIHVHHIKPLGEIGEEYEIDPIKDLRPVCPNCHAMLHRRKPALQIEELISRYQAEKRGN